MKCYALLILLAVVLVGCHSLPPGTVPGPDGTVAYKVPVDSSEPDARVEVNGEVVGKTPLVLTIYGDSDGTFHSFGTYEFVVRAYPPHENGLPLTKVYKTGALFAPEDKIPSKIFFDFAETPRSKP